MSLPHLPEAAIPSKHFMDANLYSEYQMQAYGKACREAALMESAEICRNEEWRNDGNEVAYLKAFNEGCKDCESAIRRLK